MSFRFCSLVAQKNDDDDDGGVGGGAKSGGGNGDSMLSGRYVPLKRRWGFAIGNSRAKQPRRRGLRRQWQRRILD